VIKDGNCINVYKLSKFYVVLGDYYIGVYLLEDGVMAVQQNSLTGPNIISHENVIYTIAINEYRLGVQSMGSYFTANQVVSGEGVCSTLQILELMQNYR
jgi:hypothetical protein